MMRGCELFFLETELTSELDPQVSKPQIIKGIRSMRIRKFKVET